MCLSTKNNIKPFNVYHYMIYNYNTNHLANSVPPEVGLQNLVDLVNQNKLISVCIVNI